MDWKPFRRYWNFMRRNLTGNPLHNAHTLNWAYSIGAAGSTTATDMVWMMMEMFSWPANFRTQFILTQALICTFLPQPGEDDIFISKTSPSGVVLWTKRIGGHGTDHANSIAMDHEGNVIVTGSFHETADFDPGPNVFCLSAGVDGDAYITKL